jgi:hypothetical protein
MGSASDFGCGHRPRQVLCSLCGYRKSGLDSRSAAQVFGFGQAACEGHRVFDEGVGYAVAFRVDEFVGHRLCVPGDAGKFGAEEFDGVIRAVAEPLNGDRAVVVLHCELDGLASASTGLIEVNFRLQSGEASLQVAERIGADTTDFEVLFDLCREEVGQGACAGKLDIAVGIGLGLLDELLGPGNSVLIAHSLAYGNDASAQLAHNAVDIGDYVMSQKDYDEQIVHDDTVAFTDWGPDVHHPEGFWDKGKDCIHAYQGRRTSIAYRTLYSKNIENLFMAGRCHSATHIAFGGTRVMRPCCAMGQAVGTAAAIAGKQKTTPRGVYEKHIKHLQDTLLKDGCRLMNKDGGMREPPGG